MLLIIFFDPTPYTLRRRRCDHVGHLTYLGGYIMSNIRGTISVVNNAVQSTITTTGSSLAGGASWLTNFVESELEVQAKTRDALVQMRVDNVMAEYHDHETKLLEKYGTEGIERINEIKAHFEQVAKQRELAKQRESKQRKSK